MLATFIVGALAVSRPLLAAGAGVAMALLLTSRSALHGFAHRQLSEREVRDGIMLAAAALIVLPVLPDHPIDPWGAINPRLVWRLTVLVMAIIAAGYVLQRLVGARWGLPLAGLLGGFASSTATIASMGQRARTDAAVVPSAVAGAALSSVPTVVQLALVLSVADLTTLRLLTAPLVAMGIVGAVYGGLFTLRAVAATDTDRATQISGRAFSVGTALLFAGLFCFIAILVVLLQRAFGDTGALVGAVTGGFLDAHSSSASVAGLAAPETAALLRGGNRHRTDPHGQYAGETHLRAHRRRRLLLAGGAGPGADDCGVLGHEMAVAAVGKAEVAASLTYSRKSWC